MREYTSTPYEWFRIYFTNNWRESIVRAKSSLLETSNYMDFVQEMRTMELSQPVLF